MRITVSPFEDRDCSKAFALALSDAMLLHGKVLKIVININRKMTLR